jgi:peptidoglycan-associated lipoprotein
MRKSLAHGLLMVVVTMVFASGCQTLEKWCGCGKKHTPPPPVEVVTNVPPVFVPPPDVIESNDVVQAGVPIDQLPIDANAKLESVQFAYDSALLSQREIAKVEKAAQYLLDNPDRVMHVDGHCDERGSNVYNLSLGEQRAQSIRNYLIKLGLDGERVQTRSFGKEKPLDAGHTEEAWAKNRRGEFVVYIAKK